VKIGDLVKVNKRLCNYYKDLGREDLAEKALKKIFTIVSLREKIIVVSSSDGLTRFRRDQLEIFEDEDPEAIWRLWGDQ
jgi:hypothetical protein